MELCSDGTKLLYEGIGFGGLEWWTVMDLGVCPSGRKHSLPKQSEDLALTSAKALTSASHSGMALGQRVLPLSRLQPSSSGIRRWASVRIQRPGTLASTGASEGPWPLPVSLWYLLRLLLQLRPSSASEGPWPLPVSLWYLLRLLLQLRPSSASPCAPSCLLQPSWRVSESTSPQKPLHETFHLWSWFPGTRDWALVYASYKRIFPAVVTLGLKQTREWE